MTILVSACLLGVACRYDGKSKPHPALSPLPPEHHWVPVCPEQLGGLPTPRPPSECRNGGVHNNQGQDVTAAYERGAQEALRLAKCFGCDCAVLKERSPSCGSGCIYDGTFTGTLVPGDGVTAQRLKEAGLPVYGESELEALLSQKE
jgi:uncharacterized protein YbbK (DUF523 family)